jgi:glutathione S-transferase
MASITTSLLAYNPDYIYPLVVNVLGALVPAWAGVVVGGARRKTGLKYPLEYHAGVIDEKSDHDKWLFNCAQRSHQVMTPYHRLTGKNLMENLPTFFVLFNITSATFPKFGAAMGAMWLFARVVYHLGYSKSGPKGRVLGARLSYIPILGMVCSLSLLTVAFWIRLWIVFGVYICCVMRHQRGLCRINDFHCFSMPTPDIPLLLYLLCWNLVPLILSCAFHVSLIFVSLLFIFEYLFLDILCPLLHLN